MGKSAMLFLAALMVVACAPPSAPPEAEPTADESPPPATRPERPDAGSQLAPFAHAEDGEYQSGLADVMEFAPVYGVPLITSVYRVGYLAGLREAIGMQLYFTGGIRQGSCAAGFAAAFKQLPAPPSDELVAAAKRSCRSLGRPKDMIRGRIFTSDRLQLLQKLAAGTRDPTDVKVFDVVYTVGYNMGFAHRWESVDYEPEFKRVADSACKGAARSLRPPLTPAQLAPVDQQCDEVAESYGRDDAHQARCLLVGDEAFKVHKAGCPPSQPTTTQQP